MACLRWMVMSLAGSTLAALSACAGPSAGDLWQNPPEPDPQNPADFVAWVQSCAQQGVSDNAWDIYGQLIELPAPDAGEQLYIGYAARWPWEEERFAKAAAWIERSGRAFELLREASRHQGLHAPLERNGPYLLNITSPSRNAIRVAARGLAAAGWREFYQGRPEQLHSDALVLLGVAHHLDRAPTPTGRLGKGAFSRWLYRDVLLQLLERSDDPGRLAAELLGPLRRADPPAHGLVRMVMRQYAALADMYQRIYSWDQQVGRYIMSRAEIDPLRSRFRRLRDISQEEVTERLLPSDYDASVAFIKAQRRKLAEVVDLPYADSSERLQELDEAVTSQGTYLTQGTVKKLRRFLIERWQTVAYRRATHLVYALWAHRQARGVFPESLDELDLPDLAELRRDPFSPGDFSYRRTDDGFTLYSWGVDCSDQGGSHRGDWGLQEPGDYVFWPVQPITPPWLRPRILITSDGRIFEQPRDGGPPREISPEELGIINAGEETPKDKGAGQNHPPDKDADTKGG